MLLITTYANVAPYYIYQASPASPANVGSVQSLPAAWLGGNTPTTAISNLGFRKVALYSGPAYLATRFTANPVGLGNIVSITGKRRGVHPLAGNNWRVFGEPANVVVS